MSSPSPQQFLHQLDEQPASTNLLHLVRLLRGPEGCPWDQKQTALSMIDYLIDEAHELKQALLDQAEDQIVSELGDLKFTMTFLEETLAEKAPVETVSQTVVQKMIARHPHVFDRENFDSESEIRKNWEAEKRKEREKKSQSPRRLDGDLSASLPPLRRATKVISRAMGAGFRFPSPRDAWEQCAKEFEELDAAVVSDDEEVAREELGDLLLSLLTFAKMNSIDPEVCLRASETKLCDRVEQVVALAELPLEQIPTAELPELYRRAKDGYESSPGAYLNYCGVGLWPGSVLSAIRGAVSGIGRNGLSKVLELREEREQLRDRIKDFVQAKNACTVFVPNISLAALGVAYAQAWSPGDRLVVGRQDFPANSVPWASAAETFSLELLRFDEDLFRTDPERGWAQFEKLLREQRPRLVALSAVSFWSGFRVSLERLASLCRRHQVRLFVDAIQALGTVPLEMVEGLDYLACGSHKALMAPEASGFLVVKDEVATDWRPRLASWLSLPDPVGFLTEGKLDSLPASLLPRVGDPSALEMGSLNTLGYAGLAASVRALSELGVLSIFERIQALQDKLEPELVNRGWKSLRSRVVENRSAILSFKPPSRRMLLAVMEGFGRDNISAGMPNGYLRFGFHYGNSQLDVDSVLTSLDRSTKSL